MTEEVRRHAKYVGFCTLSTQGGQSNSLYENKCKQGNKLPSADVFVDPLWMPTVLGAGLGVFYAALNRFGLRRYWRESRTPLNVVITGSTRGIGKALARELLKCGFLQSSCFHL